MLYSMCRIKMLCGEVVYGKACYLTNHDCIYSDASGKTGE